jgi:hypothetical protein
MPRIGSNTNPGGFVIAERYDGQLSVCRIFDFTAPDAALINWFPRLSPQHWVVPPIADSTLRHQTDMYQSKSKSVISSNSIVDLAFMFYSGEALEEKLNIYGIDNAYILRFHENKTGVHSLKPDSECIRFPSCYSVFTTVQDNHDQDWTCLYSLQQKIRHMLNKFYNKRQAEV